ncbi:hypothetical protein [Limnohabitans sp. B9-3]|uniref:hypothetical protein n=1 Tax=Limnohabitans sp. B9-3 TaxID=1100707 RepID=UPI00117BB452|nr:hypothetical protein [Limnohabitans sp. B9-3]
MPKRHPLSRAMTRLALLATCSGLAACTSLLPQARTESPTFQTFDEARTAIESLVPMQSHAAEVSALKLGPAYQPNTTILSYPDIVRRVVNGTVLTKADLGPGILMCINARDACHGWEVSISKISKARTGGFLADFTNFRRRSETTGWRFNALILLVDETVVYRSWGGQPEVREVDVQHNPLGPLQDIGPAAMTRR